ncbi:MAG: hypothetical protein IKU86_02675 [Thermoguttaceae bacterium]|nr:hypothetical protein [Thermoguttaceae bacterium]
MIFSPLFSLRRRARLFARSSAVAAALFSLVLGTTAFAADAATGSISPFINKDTLAVVRVNFDNIDVARLAETLDGIAATALKDFGYDAASVEKVGAELDKTFAALVEDGRAKLAEARETVLPGEAFLVLQSSKGEGLALLVPVDKASEEQRELWTTTAKLAARGKGFDAAVYQDRCLVVAQDLKAFGRYYKNFKSSENRKIESFFKQNADAFVAGYCGTLRIRPFLDAATDGESQALVSQFPRSARDALEIFDSTFVDARYVADLGTISDRTTLRFNAPVDSGRFLAAIQAFVDEIAKQKFAPKTNALADLPISEKYVEEFNLLPLARELWRGQIRSQLPKQNGAELVLERDLTKEAAKATGSAAVVGVVASFLFPAVQAARVRAQELAAPDEIDFEFEETENETLEETEVEAGEPGILKRAEPEETPVE